MGGRIQMNIIERYVERILAESAPGRPLWNIESIKAGKPNNWNYVDGCMMIALMNLHRITGEARYYDFAENFLDYYVFEDGSLRGYQEADYNLDNICEGRVLFDVYHLSGKEKYRRAIDTLYGQLLRHPRTCEGSFWHKAIYPNQVWLDGIYMAQVFYALYQQAFGGGDYSDILRQIETVHERMYDGEKGLYYHGYDASRTAFWSDPITGCSKSFWLRSIGWFSVALADLLEIVTGEDRQKLAAIFAQLMEGIARYADEETGMYYQVPDQGSRAGNYLETSGSSMIAYAMLKGARLGVLDKEYAAKGQKTFSGIVEKYLSFSGDTLNLGGICLVAGLGPENNRRRDGTFEYYISEPVVENDAKGVAPFILCYTEIKRL